MLYFTCFRISTHCMWSRVTPYEVFLCHILLSSIVARSGLVTECNTVSHLGQALLCTSTDTPEVHQKITICRRAYIGNVSENLISPTIFCYCIRQLCGCRTVKKSWTPIQQYENWFPVEFVQQTNAEFYVKCHSSGAQKQCSGKQGLVGRKGQSKNAVTNKSWVFTKNTFNRLRIQGSFE